jgi:hypothetical protein
MDRGNRRIELPGFRLFMHWRDQRKKPRHHTTADFQTHFEEDNLRRAFIFVSATRLTL